MSQRHQTLAITTCLLIPIALAVFANTSSKVREPFVATNEIAEEAQDEQVIVSPTPSIPKDEKKGLTWVKVSHNDQLGIDRVHCWGKPAIPESEGGPGCNPYQGDTSCSEALPILCVLEEGSARPPYLMVCSSHAMPGEYYCGWTGGRLGLTRPIRGLEMTSAAAADDICSQNLGSGWRMAEHHDGRYVAGMSENAFFGDSWLGRDRLSSGGWGFHGYGNIDESSRFWVRINDQTGNCWD
ncbi:MAG: hypothetical protein GY906_30290 [bacterium]|nr:hypothetical protein [bacterium]